MAVMTQAIVLHEPGAPEKLCYVLVALGKPGPNDLLVRHTAIG